MRILETKLALIFALILFWPSTILAFAQADGNGKPALNIVEAGPFRIHVHCDNQEVVDQAQRVGEQVWEIASKLYACQMPDKKLDANLYRTIDEYIAVDEKLSGGKFKKNQAFAHFNTLSAHVAMQPPISDPLLNIVGLPKQSAILLAHEMAHLVRYTRMPNSFRNHPRWLVDGTALHLDRKVITALGYMDEPMSDPDFATHAVRCKRLLVQKKLPSVEQLLNDTPLSVGFYEQYSLRWVFLDMLMSKHETNFCAFMKDLPRVGGGSGYAERAKGLLLKTLAVDTQTLNKEFREHLASLQPGWDEESRSLETSGPTWHQIAFPNSTANCWRQSSLKDSFLISLTATIQDAGRKQMNIRIGSPTSFTQFSITAGFGLNVFEFSNNKWNTLIAEEIKGLRTGVPLQISISHDDAKSETVLTLNGQAIFEGDLQGSTRNLALGAQKGSAVTWTDVNVQ